LLPAIFNKQVLSERTAKKRDGGGRVVQSLPEVLKESSGQRTQDCAESTSEMLYFKGGSVTVQQNLQSTEMSPSVLNRLHVSAASVHRETSVFSI
jgi:hypothetical protein